MARKVKNKAGSVDDEIKKLLQEEEYEEEFNDDDEAIEDDGEEEKDIDEEEVDDEETEEEVDPEEDDDTEEESEEDDSVEDEEDTGTDNKKKSEDSGKDKKTGAIIALKAENKELRKRLDTLEQKQQEKDYNGKLETLTKKYIDDGKDDEGARELAEAKVENERISDRLFDIEVERLEEKGYTDIRSKASELKPLMKAGLTLEQAYRGKYGDVSLKEMRTKVEQLEAANKNKRTKKKVAVTTGTTKTEETVRLSRRDERIFKSGEFRNSSLGGMSKKDFAKLVRDFDD